MAASTLTPRQQAEIAEMQRKVAERDAKRKPAAPGVAPVAPVTPTPANNSVVPPPAGAAVTEAPKPTPSPAAADYSRRIAFETMMRKDATVKGYRGSDQRAADAQGIANLRHEATAARDANMPIAAPLSAEENAAKARSGQIRLAEEARKQRDSLALNDPMRQGYDNAATHFEDQVTGASPERKAVSGVFGAMGMPGVAAINDAAGAGVAAKRYAETGARMTASQGRAQEDALQRQAAARAEYERRSGARETMNRLSVAPGQIAEAQAKEAIALSQAGADTAASTAAIAKYQSTPEYQQRQIAMRELEQKTQADKIRAESEVASAQARINAERSQQATRGESSKVAMEDEGINDATIASTENALKGFSMSSFNNGNVVEGTGEDSAGPLRQSDIALQTVGKLEAIAARGPEYAKAIKIKAQQLLNAMPLQRSDGGYGYRTGVFSSKTEETNREKTAINLNDMLARLTALAGQ